MSGLLIRGRRRALWMALQLRGQILEGKHVLHFAPERRLEDRIRPSAVPYQIADRYWSDVDPLLNFEAMDLSSESVDMLICDHVLEHVYYVDYLRVNLNSAGEARAMLN